VLDNGMTVMFLNTPTQTITGRLRVYHGGLNERAGEEGLAHFLEHSIMCGGGRNHSPEEARKRYETFAMINANTSPISTQFTTDIIAEDLESFLIIISDIVFHPRLDKTAIEQERRRILREMMDRRNSPYYKHQRDFVKARYGINSPFSYDTLGKISVIKNASSRELRAFHSRGYNPNNMDLILVGGLPENFEDLVTRYFKDEKKGHIERYDLPEDPGVKRQTVLQRYDPDLYNKSDPEESSASLAMCFLAPPIESEDAYVVSKLANILGSDFDTNSRLFKRISQEMGLTYAIHSQYENREKTGSFNIHGKVQAKKKDKAIDAIFEEMDILKEEPIDPEALNNMNRKNDYFIAKFQESNAGQCTLLEHELDTGMTPEMLRQRAKSVTPEMIQAAARRYFPTDRESGKYVMLLRNPLKE